MKIVTMIDDLISQLDFFLVSFVFGQILDIFYGNYFCFL